MYIDDILLFSHESHQKLLLDFFHIVQEHEVWDEVLFAFYVWDSKIIFSKSIFEAEQLFVREKLIFEVNDSGKRGVVHVDKEFMAD